VFRPTPGLGRPETPVAGLYSFDTGVGALGDSDRTGEGNIVVQQRASGHQVAGRPGGEHLLATLFGSVSSGMSRHMIVSLPQLITRPPRRTRGGDQTASLASPESDR
jgi:hypothetical protein